MDRSSWIGIFVIAGIVALFFLGRRGTASTGVMPSSVNTSTGGDSFCGVGTISPGVPPARHCCHISLLGAPAPCTIFPVCKPITSNPIPVLPIGRPSSPVARPIPLQPIRNPGTTVTAVSVPVAVKLPTRIYNYGMPHYRAYV